MHKNKDDSGKKKKKKDDAEDPKDTGGTRNNPRFCWLLIHPLANGGEKN